MPIYDYRCTKGHTFEVMQSVNDDPLTKCEVCGNPVQRVLHPPAVHFKGSGFYNTDYGTRKRQRSGGGESGESSGEKTESKSEKSDSKPSTSEKSKPAKSE